MTPSKEELEKIAESDEWRNKMFPCRPPCDTWGICDNCYEANIFDVGFSRGAQWQASHTTAVSVEGEKAYEAWCEREGNLRTDFERDAFIAGFQARSPLVELLRETKQVLDTLLLNDLARDIYYRIDAALKGEK